MKSVCTSLLLLLLALPLTASADGKGHNASDVAEPRFALMLYEDSKYQSPTAADSEARVAEYSAWIRSIAATGAFADGAEISGESFIIDAKGNAVATRVRSDRGVLAGYFIIGAKDAEAAKTIAATCPHLKYGGTIALQSLAM